MTPYFERDGITIFHGDCREVLPTLTAGSVDLVLTDPPYGIGYATNFVVRGVGAPWLGSTIGGDNDPSLRDSVLASLAGLPMFVFGSWKVTRPAKTRAVLIWDKGPERGMGDLSFPWKPSFDEIYVLGEGFRGKRDEAVLKGFGLPSWVAHGRCHPNEKPVALLRYLIGKTDATTVLDPFMGSGTTLRAAFDLGRNAVGIEIDEKFCEIAARRLSQMVLPLAI
jgi:site-specific DNA-methyltransferase (adenine-specific)